MKRVILILILLLSTEKLSICQSKEPQFMIVNIQSQTVLVNEEPAEVKQIITGKDSITWLSDDADMRIMPLSDYIYEDSSNHKQTWYKGVVYGISPIPSEKKNNNLFWWIKYNKSSTKGIEFSFDQIFFMNDDTLIIERPMVLNKDEKFEFVSIENGRSFCAVNDKTKPLIYITKDMLNSIGFDGTTIILKVIFHDRIDATIFANSMIITSIK